jgi:hypothetical protein
MVKLPEANNTIETIKMSKFPFLDVKHRLNQVCEKVRQQNPQFHQKIPSFNDCIQDRLHGRHTLGISRATSSSEMKELSSIVASMLLDCWEQSCPWMSYRVRRITVSAVLSGIIAVCALAKTKLDLALATPILAEGIIVGLTSMHNQGASNRTLKRQQGLLRDIVSSITQASLLFMFAKSQREEFSAPNIIECISRALSVGMLAICQNVEVFPCGHAVLVALRLAVYKGLGVFSKMETSQKTIHIIQTQMDMLLRRQLEDLIEQPKACCDTCGVHKSTQKTLPVSPDSTRMGEILTRLVENSGVFSDAYL